MTTAERLSMPLGETMFSQRAIRRFKPDPIPEEDLRDILEAAIRAPNGGNNQPWHFLVVRDQELREELGQFVPGGLVGEAERRRHQWPRGHSAGKEHTALGNAPRRRICPCSGSGAAVLNGESRGSRLGDTSGPETCCWRRGPWALAVLLLRCTPKLMSGFINCSEYQTMSRLCTAFPWGNPRGRFGSVQRKPLTEVCSYERWGNPVT